MKTNRKYLIVALTCLIIATTLFIWSNSMKQSAVSLQQSNKVGEIVRPIIDAKRQISEKKYSFNIRKAAHFIEFAFLGSQLTVLFTLLNKHRLHALWICIVVAIIDETIQKFVSRSSSVKDVVLDSVGALVGIVLMISIIEGVKMLKQAKNADKSLNS